MAIKPNVYFLGGVQELRMAPKDQDGVFFVPSEMRLSIKPPTGTILTVSGGEVTLASGFLYFRYRPATIGWYEYESWVKDASGGETVQSNGFEVIDRVY
jgi:hypothetical protein